jgi:hypothetical protein
MKAESFIMNGVQKPITFLGLPIALLFLAFFLALLSAAFMFMLKHPAFALPVAIAVLAIAWIKSYRASRRDMHVVQTSIMSPAFWQRKKTRRFIAGLPPSVRKSK